MSTEQTQIKKIALFDDRLKNGGRIHWDSDKIIIDFVNKKTKVTATSFSGGILKVKSGYGFTLTYKVGDMSRICRNSLAIDGTYDSFDPFVEAEILYGSNFVNDMIEILNNMVDKKQPIQYTDIKRLFDFYTKSVYQFYCTTNKPTNIKNLKFTYLDGMRFPIFTFPSKNIDLIVSLREDSFNLTDITFDDLVEKTKIRCQELGVTMDIKPQTSFEIYKFLGSIGDKVNDPELYIDTIIKIRSYLRQDGFAQLSTEFCWDGDTNAREMIDLFHELFTNPNSVEECFAKYLMLGDCCVNPHHRSNLYKEKGYTIYLTDMYDLQEFRKIVIGNNTDIALGLHIAKKFDTKVTEPIGIKEQEFLNVINTTWEAKMRPFRGFLKVPTEKFFEYVEHLRQELNKPKNTKNIHKCLGRIVAELFANQQGSMTYNLFDLNKPSLKDGVVKKFNAMCLIMLDIMNYTRDTIIDHDSYNVCLVNEVVVDVMERKNPFNLRLHDGLNDVEFWLLLGLLHDPYRDFGDLSTYDIFVTPIQKTESPIKRFKRGVVSEVVEHEDEPVSSEVMESVLPKLADIPIVPIDTPICIMQQVSDMFYSEDGAITSLPFMLDDTNECDGEAPKDLVDAVAQAVFHGTESEPVSNEAFELVSPQKSHFNSFEEAIVDPKWVIKNFVCLYYHAIIDGRFTFTYFSKTLLPTLIDRLKEDRPLSYFEMRGILLGLDSVGVNEQFMKWMFDENHDLSELFESVVDIIQKHTIVMEITQSIHDKKRPF